jgi:hypothetical protein
MDMTSVEKDLQRRIDQSREWLSGKPALITDLKIRNYPCQVEPVKFLDDPHMKARHGVLFRLEFVTERGTFEAYVETRIMPTRSIRKDEELDPPFVCCSAFNPETKKRDLITWDFVQNIDFYKRNLDTPIEEWYKGWLFKALIHKKVSKIFKFMKEK